MNITERSGERVRCTVFLVHGIVKADRIALCTNLDMCIFGLNENRVRFHRDEFSWENNLLGEWFYT